MPTDLTGYCDNIVQIEKWPEHQIINYEIDESGKHIIDFDKNFPFIIMGYNVDLNYPLTPNYHDYLEIGYIFDGKLCIKFNKNKFNLNKGDLILIGNNQFHTFLANKTSRCHYLTIQFLPELIYSPGGNKIDFEYIRPFYDSNQVIGNKIVQDKIKEEFLFNTFNEMFKEMKSNNLVSKLKIITLLKQFLIEIVKYYEKYSNGSYGKSIKRIDEIEKLREVFRLLQTKYNNNITLDDAAHVAYMNKHYFSKYFHKVTGNTFSDYLKNVRIDKAKELLFKSELNIGKIAFEVGFNNLSNFYHSFKQTTNCTPLEFKINMSRKNKV